MCLTIPAVYLYLGPLLYRVPLNSRRRYNLSALCMSTYIYIYTCIDIYTYFTPFFYAGTFLCRLSPNPGRCLTIPALYTYTYIYLSISVLCTFDPFPIRAQVLFFVVCHLTLDDDLISPRCMYLPISVSLYPSYYIHTFSCAGPLLYHLSLNSRRRLNLSLLYTSTYIYLYVSICIYLCISVLPTVCSFLIRALVLFYIVCHLTLDDE